MREETPVVVLLIKGPWPRWAPSHIDRCVCGGVHKFRHVWQGIQEEGQGGKYRSKTRRSRLRKYRSGHNLWAVPKVTEETQRSNRRQKHEHQRETNIRLRVMKQISRPSLEKKIGVVTKKAKNYQKLVLRTSAVFTISRTLSRNSQLEATLTPRQHHLQLLLILASLLAQLVGAFWLSLSLRWRSLRGINTKKA